MERKKFIALLVIFEGAAFGNRILARLRSLPVGGRAGALRPALPTL